MSKRIPVSDLKALAKKHQLSHLVLFCHRADGECDHVVTFGTTVEFCAGAAAMGNKIKKLMGWPKKFCNDQPSRVRKLQKKVKELEEMLESYRAAAISGSLRPI